MLRWILFLLMLALTAGLITALSVPILPGAPPLGRFFSPFHGFWQNADPGDPVGQFELQVAGLKGPVTILVDDRLTPHVFAKHTEDVYFAQGYITARLRLWQMETQVRAAGGRLAEVLGPDLLPMDRFHRRIGMVQAAEAAVTAMQQDSATARVVDAYVKGVNAWISSLEPHRYPLEYKLLDYAPEAWTPLKTALLLKYMAWDLTGHNKDFRLSNVLNRYGRKVTDDLFPNHAPWTDPVMPPETKWNFEDVHVPRAPLKKFMTDSVYLTDAQTFAPHAWNGSNNWAVSGSRTASGYPILANDPHLSLSLPSLWFEIQLVGPDLNVYGVTLPGAPAVIIGFNEHVSWGLTNTGADVLDWYRIAFRDAGMNEYLHGREWRPVTRRAEVIQVRGSATVYDTVLYTHHGPIVYEDVESTHFKFGQVPVRHALRWLAHEPSNELQTFLGLNKARDYDDYEAALAHHVCPAQNFIYADAHNVAIRSNGQFPLRWPGQGKFLLDGSDPQHDWQGWVPRRHIPAVKNPKRGFVSSANQAPTDSTYPYYLGWDFADWERGARINQRLTQMQRATVDTLRLLQNDNYGMLAARVLPRMLALLKRRPLDVPQTSTAELLGKWDYHFAAESQAAPVFDLWWDLLEARIWDDDFPAKLQAPRRDRTAQLLWGDTASRWFDDRRTPVRETLPRLLRETFIAAHDSLARVAPGARTWAHYRKVGVPHLSRSKALRVLGRWNLPVGGDGGCVNAIRQDAHGPSWRMVVSLGPYVRGFGIYPGGQNGNPASRYYDNFLETWVKGELQELYFMRTPDRKSRRIIGAIDLSTP